MSSDRFANVNKTTVVKQLRLNSKIRPRKLPSALSAEWFLHKDELIATLRTAIMYWRNELEFKCSQYKNRWIIMEGSNNFWYPKEVLATPPSLHHPQGRGKGTRKQIAYSHPGSYFFSILAWEKEIFIPKHFIPSYWVKGWFKMESPDGQIDKRLVPRCPFFPAFTGAQLTPAWVGIHFLAPTPRKHILTSLEKAVSEKHYNNNISAPCASGER